MKTIVAGTRTVTSRAQLDAALWAATGDGITVTEVVSGGARGVDKLGERWAAEYGVPVTVFPADWNRFGRAAGPIRNALMAEYAEALVAVWDGHSSGTSSMIKLALERGLKVFVWRVTAT